MPQHQLKDASKKNWTAPVDKEGGYPGDENVKIGCLQRIADATEAMAKNYTDMQNSLDWLKQDRKRLQARNETLIRSNNALRGHINRMKKSKK